MKESITVWASSSSCKIKKAMNLCVWDQKNSSPNCCHSSINNNNILWSEMTRDSSRCRTLICIQEVAWPTKLCPNKMRNSTSINSNLLVVVMISANLSRMAMLMKFTAMRIARLRTSALAITTLATMITRVTLFQLIWWKERIINNFNNNNCYNRSHRRRNTCLHDTHANEAQVRRTLWGMVAVVLAPELSLPLDVGRLRLHQPQGLSGKDRHQKKR